MKGITPVLSLILLVLIVVVIIGISFGWFITTFSSTQTQTSQQLSVIQENMGKLIGVESADCTAGRVIVKNIGATTIKAGEVTVYDGSTNPSNTADIEPGKTESISITCNPGTILTVAGPANSITITG